MDKTSQALIFRPVNSIKLNNYSTKKGLSTTQSLEDYNSEKENNQNIMLSSTAFLSHSCDDSFPETSTTIEDTFTPTANSLFSHKPQSVIRKDSDLFCENINYSIDEAFLSSTIDSLDHSGSYFSASVDIVDYPVRPSISETAYLMNSFSTDEMNSVRQIPSQTTNTMMGAKKLSLINPSAIKGISVRSTWQVTSPTDRNYIMSPSKALKRKYKSRSQEEYGDI